jgi:phosphate transport system substrate-binding protein
VTGSQYAMGYLPFAYYTNNSEQTKALQLDEGDDQGCVEPSLPNAKSGEYGLARPLFIYVNSQRLQEKPALQQFVRFYIENATRDNLLAEQIGYVPIDQDTAQSHLDTVDEYTE